MKSAIQLVCLLGLVLLNLTSAVSLGYAREMKESGEKGGTEDINIGVGELQECTLHGVLDIGPVSYYEFELAYDASILEFTRATDVLFGGVPLDVQVTPNHVRLSATGDAMSSSGDFFLIQFIGLMPGASTLAVSDEHVFDTQMPPQEYAPEGANVLTITVVPEPSALFLSTVGLLGCATWRYARGLDAIWPVYRRT